MATATTGVTATNDVERIRVLKIAITAPTVRAKHRWLKAAWTEHNVRAKAMTTGIRNEFLLIAACGLDLHHRVGRAAAITHGREG